VQATPAAPKYDAFKHRSFIYDEEDDEGFDALSPGLLAMGYTPAVRKRAPTVESEEEFQPTLPASTASDLQNAVDEENGEEGQKDADDEDDAGDGDDASSESAETYDSEDNGEEDSDGAEGQDSGDTGNETGEQGEETTPEDGGEGEGEGSTATGEAAAVDRASNPAALYKLPGGSKHREPRAHHAPKSLPHTNSGTTMEAPTFKVTTNSRYQKGGGSWIKNDSPGGTMLGALSNTPAKGHHQPKQIIPTSDSKQPLARRHSSMINQCESLSCVRGRQERLCYWYRNLRLPAIRK
jgi:hypothetical protein